MYIDVIMLHVHISTTHYVQYIRNYFFIMIPIDTISMAISVPLLKYYCSTILQL
jgi:general stress protein CsbA